MATFFSQESYTLDTPLSSVEERLPESFFLEEEAVKVDKAEKIKEEGPEQHQQQKPKEVDFSEFQELEKVNNRFSFFFSKKSNGTKTIN